MLDASDRNKDIVTCETCSIGTGTLSQPDLLPPKVHLTANMAVASSRYHESIHSLRTGNKENGCWKTITEKLSHDLCSSLYLI